MLKDYQNYYFPFPEKRVKERSVDDALYRVNEWRRLYEQGITQENKKKQRITLEEAAKLVQIPKKTLEDYVQIFKKVRLISQIEEFSNKRMGFLRAFIRKNKAKIKKAALIQKQQMQKGNLEIKKEHTDFDDNKISVKKEEEDIQTNSEIKLEIKCEQDYESYNNMY
ncbi:unnamed protein product [Paramecium sonneborni]|uniref:Uncharacterized protein n=1 Tax=Paramecium sonneborni TaxID=65129 RepID=A0A8S1MBK3_9CILI|nr:unnamed protein product [Paramecium sonneborni]